MKSIDPFNIICVTRKRQKNPGKLRMKKIFLFNDVETNGPIQWTNMNGLLLGVLASVRALYSRVPRFDSR